jgi:hypothetical protein
VIFAQEWLDVRALTIAIILAAMFGWAAYSAPSQYGKLYSDNVDVDWLIKLEQAKRHSKAARLGLPGDGAAQ